MRLETELREKGTKLQDLLDWLAKAEQALAAEQPLNEKSPQVKQQYTTHKVLPQVLKCTIASINYVFGISI